MSGDAQSRRDALRRRLEALHAASSADFARTTAAITAASGVEIGCRPGCSSCCVDGLTVFAPEAAAIEALLRAPGAPALVVGPVGGCALLTADGRCQAYAARPYVCRTQGGVLRWWASSASCGAVRPRTPRSLVLGALPLLPRPDNEPLPRLVDRVSRLGDDRADDDDVDDDWADDDWADDDWADDDWAADDVLPHDDGPHGSSPDDDRTRERGSMVDLAHDPDVVERRATCEVHLVGVDLATLPEAALLDVGPREGELTAIATDALSLAGGRGLPERVALRALAEAIAADQDAPSAVK